MPAVTCPAQRHVTWVECDLHSEPDPDGCSRCHDAAVIVLRVAHERGWCGGPGFCDWCRENN